MGFTSRLFPPWPTSKVFFRLVVYFLVSLIRGLREANSDLQKQLVLERTEEKRKIYQMAGGENFEAPNISKILVQTFL